MTHPPPTVPIDLLRNDPILQGLPGLLVSHLIGSAEQCRFSAGGLMCKHGESADHFYLIESGLIDLTLPSGKQVESRHGHCGQEALASLQAYACTVTARSEVIAWRFPRASVARAASAYPRLVTDGLLSLASSQTGETIKPVPTVKAKSDRVAGISTREVIGWMVTIFAPLPIFLACTSFGLTAHAAIFTAILLLVVSMWIFQIVDEFIPPIIAVVATVFVGLAPASIALGGFSSPSLMTMVGVFALASTISASGLSFRAMLWVLGKLPDRPFWQQSTLLVGGLVISPIVPSGNNRLTILLPLYKDMSDGLGLPVRSIATTALLAATVSGALLFSPMMATSKPSSIAAINLLPPQLQAEFMGLTWLYAAAAAIVGLTVLHIFGMRIFLRASNPGPIPRSRINLQLHALGPLSLSEWLSLTAFAAFMIGTASVSLHHIQPAWIAGCVLVTLLVSGTLGKIDFIKQIDWSMIFFLLGIDSIVRIMKYLAIDTQLSNALSSNFDFVNGRVDLFVLGSLITTMAIRMVMPVSAGALVSAVILMPVANTHGINPWICIFLSALFSDIWLFPHQSSVWMQVVSQGLAETIERRRFMLYTQFMNLARIAVAFLSIPYWKWLGLQ